MKVFTSNSVFAWIALTQFCSARIANDGLPATNLRSLDLRKRDFDVVPDMKPGSPGAIAGAHGSDPGKPGDSTESSGDSSTPKDQPDSNTPDTPSDPYTPDNPDGGSDAPPVDPYANILWQPAFPIGQYLKDNKQAPFTDGDDGAEWNLLEETFGAIIKYQISFEAEASDSSTGDGSSPGNSQQQPDNKESLLLSNTLVKVQTTDGTLVTISSTISTSTFYPASPASACDALSTLASYCSGASIECRCNSRGYYVPDQWNSLAAACGRYQCPSDSASQGGSNVSNLCSQASTARSMVSYCAVADVDAVSFGASMPMTNSATPTSTSVINALTTSSATPTPTSGINVLMTSSATLNPISDVNVPTVTTTDVPGPTSPPAEGAAPPTTVCGTQKVFGWLVVALVGIHWW